MEVHGVEPRDSGAVTRVNGAKCAFVDGCLATKLEKLVIGRDEFILHSGLPNGVPQKCLSELPWRKPTQIQGVFVRRATVQGADAFDALPQIVEDQETDCRAEDCTAAPVVTRLDGCDQVLALDWLECVAQQADIVVRLIELASDLPLQIGNEGGAGHGLGKRIVVLPHPKAVEQNLAMTQG